MQERLAALFEERKKMGEVFPNQPGSNNPLKNGRKVYMAPLQCCHDINNEIHKSQQKLQYNGVLSSHSFRVGFVTRHLKHNIISASLHAHAVYSFCSCQRRAWEDCHCKGARPSSSCTPPASCW